MEIENIYNRFLQSSGVKIDTRKITHNCLFVALKGDNFDANTFAEEAIALGATTVIVDNEKFFTNSKKMILVEDSLKCLQELAQFHRKQLKLPIIALTGSNGKTTTKELINVVLSKKFKTKATIGNLNNHIGVPLTILSFNSETEIGIVEMGANHQKEIEFLCNLAQPDYGYITNFGKAHLEGFGGFEGVIIGKSEMYTFLRTNKKKVFVNLDDQLQDEKTRTIDRITFSQKSKNSFVFIETIKANPMVTISYENEVVKSHLIGLYNANNINAAITIGKYFGVSNSEIKAAIESYVPENNRSQLLSKGSNEIILDAYNANPSSMKVALENFIQLENKDKIAIIGDMFELGKESEEEHKLIVDFVLENKNLKCIFIGNDFYKNQKENTNFEFFETFENFIHFLNKNKIENKTILIKGSRGMALERSLDFL
jgi:UDP-N-acetylmuramoyl-tripeptide--D-alanyl-D-alanine ligase